MRRVGTTAVKHLWRAGLLVVVLLALSARADARGSGVLGVGSALDRPAATVSNDSSASCPAVTPVQVITVINRAAVWPWALAKVENALVAQSIQLRAAWGTPCVQFGPEGWPVILVATAPAPPFCDGNRGCHCPPIALPPACTATGEPYAQIATGGQPITDRFVSIAVSHEVMEMLANPEDLATGHEVCDPVEDGSYRVADVWVSDFVTPAWFSGSPGRKDQAGLVHRAHQMY
jgi:hypothetical protein